MADWCVYKSQQKKKWFSSSARYRRGLLRCAYRANIVNRPINTSSHMRSGVWIGDRLGRQGTNNTGFSNVCTRVKGAKPEEQQKNEHFFFFWLTCKWEKPGKTRRWWFFVARLSGGYCLCSREFVDPALRLQQKPKEKNANLFLFVNRIERLRLLLLLIFLLLHIWYLLFIYGLLICNAGLFANW